MAWAVATVERAGLSSSRFDFSLDAKDSSVPDFNDHSRGEEDVVPHRISGLDLLHGDESAPERSNRRLATSAMYFQSFTFLLAAAIWALHEEDVEKKRRCPGPDGQLFYCPKCERQEVVKIGSPPVCRGSFRHRHPKESMIRSGRQE